MLCDVCRKIGLSEDGHAELVAEEQEKTHHESYTTLVESVNLGCLICVRLWNALTLDEERFVFNSLKRNPLSDLDEQSTNNIIDGGAVTKARVGWPGLITPPQIPIVPIEYLLQFAFETVTGFPADTGQYWRVRLSLLLSKLPSL